MSVTPREMLTLIVGCNGGFGGGGSFNGGGRSAIVLRGGVDVVTAGLPSPRLTAMVEVRGSQTTGGASQVGSSYNGSQYMGGSGGGSGSYDGSRTNMASSVQRNHIRTPLSLRAS